MTNATMVEAPLDPLDLNNSFNIHEDVHVSPRKSKNMLSSSTSSNTSLFSGLMRMDSVRSMRGLGASASSMMMSVAEEETETETSVAGTEQWMLSTSTLGASLSSMMAVDENGEFGDDDHDHHHHHDHYDDQFDQLNASMNTFLSTRVPVPNHRMTMTPEEEHNASMSTFASKASHRTALDGLYNASISTFASRSSNRTTSTHSTSQAANGAKRAMLQRMQSCRKLVSNMSHRLSLDHTTPGFQRSSSHSIHLFSKTKAGNSGGDRSLPPPMTVEQRTRREALMTKVNTAIEALEQEDADLQASLDVHIDRAKARYFGGNKRGALLSMKRVRRMQNEQATVLSSLAFLHSVESDIEQAHNQNKHSPMNHIRMLLFSKKKNHNSNNNSNKDNDNTTTTTGGHGVGDGRQDLSQLLETLELQVDHIIASRGGEEEISFASLPKEFCSTDEDLLAELVEGTL